MKNMKRIAALGLSAVLAATALAGCGSSSSTSTSTDSSASTGDTAAADTSASTGDKVKLTLGSWTSQPEVLQDLIDAYEAENLMLKSTSRSHLTRAASTGPSWKHLQAAAPLLTYSG